ncbi:MAG: hypothetical protein LBC72_05550, partial [Spirochaetaceae bacterium]|nr:hypothetical protein [Spirochaetaceae bacterium]
MRRGLEKAAAAAYYICMDTQNIAASLHPLEIKVILAFEPGAELSAEIIEQRLALKAGNGNQALSWLAGKDIVAESRREKAVFYELTQLGGLWAEQGSP